MKTLVVIFFIPLFLTCCAVKEKVPLQRKGVFDNAGMLSATAVDSLEVLIKQLEDETGSQIGVITVTSLNGESIEQFGFRIFSEWKLGRLNIDDGVLISVSHNDRMVRIDVGTGLENIIKDEISAGIIRDEMIPSFIEGRFGNGLYAGLAKISGLIRENSAVVGQRPEYIQHWDSLNRGL
jgi:uncharacterized protein